MISKFLLGGKGFVTNAKVYQGFRDDKKIEKHCSTFNRSSNI